MYALEADSLNIAWFALCWWFFEVGSIGPEGSSLSFSARICEFGQLELMSFSSKCGKLLLQELQLVSSIKVHEGSVTIGFEDAGMRVVSLHPFLPSPRRFAHSGLLDP